MTIQERKLQIIHQLGYTNDKVIIEEIEQLLEKIVVDAYEKSLKPMSKAELISRVNKAEKDIKEKKVFSQKQVSSYFRAKFK
jgi:hypothetical protein